MNPGPKEWLDTAEEYGLCIETTYADGEQAIYVLESGMWSRIGKGIEGPVTPSAVMNAIQHCDPDVRLRGVNAIHELEDEIEA